MKDGKEDKKSINDERNDVGECRKRKRHCTSENIGNITMTDIYSRQHIFTNEV